MPRASAVSGPSDRSDPNVEASVPTAEAVHGGVFRPAVGLAVVARGRGAPVAAGCAALVPRDVVVGTDPNRPRPACPLGADPAALVENTALAAPAPTTRPAAAMNTAEPRLRGGGPSTPRSVIVRAEIAAIARTVLALPAPATGPGRTGPAGCAVPVAILTGNTEPSAPGTCPPDPPFANEPTDRPSCGTEPRTKPSPPGRDAPN